MEHRCLLCRPAVRAGLVIGSGLVVGLGVDFSLPASGHSTISVDAGRRPGVSAAVVLAGAVVALAHLNWGRLRGLRRSPAATS